MVERLFLAEPRGCLQFVIVVFPDHAHLLFLGKIYTSLEKIPSKGHVHLEPPINTLAISLAPP